jgi:NADPH2:quinone reductase
VVYASGPGSYAEARTIEAARAVIIPDWLSFEDAAAIMLQGMTAHYLIHDSFRVRPGHIVLLHAAAGGVGTLLSSWANRKGAIVIGTVGSAAKAEVAKAHGCHHVIDYAKEDFAARVKDITKGAGVNVVYDAVGQSTFLKSLECLKSRGTMVSFGQASGLVPPFELTLLAKNSLFLTRPSLNAHTSRRDELLLRASETFEAVRDGTISIRIGARYPLAQAAEAQSALESRKTTGKVILTI